MEVKIKETHRNDVVLFGGKGRKKLGERSQKELRDLAILAHQSGDKSLLERFENLPSLEELQGTRVKETIAKPAEPAKVENQAPKADKKVADKGAK